MISLQITGVDDIKYWLESGARAIRKDFPRLLRVAVKDLRDYAERITHRVSGKLATSHRVADFRVYTSIPYAGHEHDRGGSHAFYTRTVEERWPENARRIMHELDRRI